MTGTATEALERAIDLRRRDRLAHLWADMAVAMAMEQMRKEHRDGAAERRPLRYAHDVATLATTILISELITKDGAIATLRAELEAHKEQLDRLIKLTPPSVTLKTITGEPE
jgi:hypothetical protein